MFEQIPDVQEFLAQFLLYLTVFAVFVIGTIRATRSNSLSVGAVLVVIVAGISSLALTWWGYHHQDFVPLALAWATVLSSRSKLK